ncbi:hypothetical protein [Sessilibacter corallicola]|uniref:hypothetical protein n=1 Tax=Sessilibacter corallicola TaxID=2904075 RepID=UPI001E611051|nr:hypothetical protein [Sessilibacter corallicola]MCE2029002.1 hypothetical protein [Sessilibacter corallicola]
MNKKEFALTGIQFDLVNKIGAVIVESDDGKEVKEPAEFLESMDNRSRMIFLIGYLQSMNDKNKPQDWDFTPGVALVE